MISPVISKMTHFFLLGVLSVVLTISCASESSQRKDISPSALATQEIESSRSQVKGFNSP